MSEETVKRIGKPISGEAERDAIHVAVYPAIAGKRLSPGMPVCLVDGKAYPVDRFASIGIVDPFLDGLREAGERFWVFIHPCTITGLRHNWTHPDLEKVPPPVDKSVHEEWLRDFAIEWDLDYDDMIREGVGAGEICGGTENYGANVTAFWEHLEALTGKTFDDEHRDQTAWRCAC
jgi:hypothetical protein